MVFGGTSEGSSSRRGGLTQTLVGVVGRGSAPRPVVVERLADAAVVTVRVVFAAADQPSCVLHTLAGVAVALAPEAAQAIVSSDTPLASALPAGGRSLGWRSQRSTLGVCKRREEQPANQRRAVGP